MLIALAKSWGKRGASYQSAVMVSCLTISHTCLLCLPSGRVSHCVPDFLKWEVAAILANGCGIQGQNYVAWLQEVKCWWEVDEVGRWERWKGNEVASWERRESGEQSIPYENHYDYYKKLASRSWPVLFTLTNFFLLHTLFSSAAK